MAILDTYSNITAAWSMDRVLLAAYGGALYTTATGVSSWNDQTGNARHMVQATAANQPVVTTAGPKARACAAFDGVNDVLAGAALSNFITASTGYIVTVFLPRAATTDNAAPAYMNDAAWADANGYAGVYFTSSGKVYANSFGAGSSVALHSGIPINGPVLVAEWKQESGTLWFRLNGGSWASAAAGNIGAMTNALRFGAPYPSFGTWSDLYLFEAVSFNVIPSVAQQDALVADMVARYAGSVFVNKLFASTVYKNTNAGNYFNALAVNKMTALAAYRKLPFYILGDTLRSSQLVGYPLGATPVAIRTTDARSASKDDVLNIYILAVGAPALHSQKAIPATATTANLSVTTTGTTGTIYWVMTPTKDVPSKAQIIAGQSATGAAAAASGTIAVSLSGVKTVTASGLIADASYWAHWYQVAADAKQSNIVSGACEPVPPLEPAMLPVVIRDDVLTEAWGFSNYNLRQSFPGFAGAAQIRLTLQSSAAEPFQFDAAYLGHMDPAAMPSWLSTGDRVQLTIGGATSYTIPANTEVVTDWITFTPDPSKIFGVAVHCNGSLSSDGTSKTTTTVAGCSTYYKASANETSTVSVSGYTPVANTVAFVSKIEILLPNNLAVTAVAVEALHSGAPNLRVSAAAVEALHSGAPDLRVSTTFVEVLHN
jgi:hypothetical protein